MCAFFPDANSYRSFPSAPTFLAWPAEDVVGAAAGDTAVEDSLLVEATVAAIGVVDEAMLPIKHVPRAFETRI
jgi:hypothetical protein